MVWNQSFKSLAIAFCLFWFISGCENRKYSQCQSIIAIANQATGRVQEITNDSTTEKQYTANWLQAADIMKVAAKEIEALSIDDPQLIDYQNNLATIFRVYARATYDAVAAREKKNISALQAASNNAREIAKVNRDLVTKINSYCQVN